MNKAEKQALWSFIVIYTFSSLLLMSIIATLYYNKEVDSAKRACKKDLQETVMDVEITLLNAQMQGKEFIFVHWTIFFKLVCMIAMERK